MLLLGGTSIIVILPLVIYSYITIAENTDLANTKWPKFTHSYLEKGKVHRSQYYQLKCDIEVYAALYLTAVVFIGWSSLILVFFVWQFL